MNTGLYSKAMAALVIAGALVAPSLKAQSLIITDTDSVVVDYGALSDTRSSKTKKTRKTEPQRSYPLLPMPMPTLHTDGVSVGNYEPATTQPATRSARSSKRKTVAAVATSRQKPTAVSVASTSSQRKKAPRTRLSTTEVSVNYGALNAPELKMWPGFPFENSGSIALLSPQQQQQQQRTSILLKKEENTSPAKVMVSTDTTPSRLPEMVTETLPTPLSLLGPHKVVVVFPVNSSSLPVGAKPDLEALLKHLREKENLKITIRTYGEGKAAGAARKLSLARALSLRTFFTQNGISHNRVDIEALGSTAEMGKSNAASIDIAS